MAQKKDKIREFELDLGRYELRRSGLRIKLEKKPMELLIFLVSRRDQLVSRQDISAKLWRSDLFVDTERNINNIIRKIRAALSDDPEKPIFLETVVGKGYKFIGPLRVIHARFPSAEAQRIVSTAESPLRQSPAQAARYTRDPMAYNEFMQGYRRSSSGERHLLEESAQHLSNAVTRDPSFALAHAILSYVCAVLHFEFEPSWMWLEKAEFHCHRALEINPYLPEGHVANAFLLWGPSKNFQHLEAIAELKRSLQLQSNLPHAYNRLGTILAHIGLLDSARAMYERGRSFDPRKSISHSIIQVHIWSGEFDLAQEEIDRWRSENPANKYAIYFAPHPALLTGKWKQAKALLDEATRLLSEDPMIASLYGVFHALTGNSQQALRFMNRACANPKTFGHAHHTYYQVACILSILGRLDSAFEWFQRSVDTGFACWPFFLKDPCLQNLRSMPQFETLVNSLQAKYPVHLGTLPPGLD